jgi:hypothetical protein
MEIVSFNGTILCNLGIPLTVHGIALNSMGVGFAIIGACFYCDISNAIGVYIHGAYFYQWLCLLAHQYLLTCISCILYWLFNVLPCF